MECGHETYPATRYNITVYRDNVHAPEQRHSPNAGMAQMIPDILQKARLFAILLFSFCTFCAGTRLCSLETPMNSNPEIRKEIEDNGLFFTTQEPVSAVYYLFTFNKELQELSVSYFVVWEQEYPDFGRSYSTNFMGKLAQVFVPLFYTNWLYLPKTGGMQRILYGKQDVEGIFAVFRYSHEIETLKFCVFDSIGHNVIVRKYPERNSHVCIKTISWNHMVNLETVCDYAFRVHPRYFDKTAWNRLNMNRRRAESAKRWFKRAGGSCEP